MICDVFRAPAFLAISRPLRNTMTSGNPANIEVASHTLIFFGIRLGKTNVGRFFCTSVNIGAITWQDPHQGAQNPRQEATSSCLKCSSSLASSRSKGTLEIVPLCVDRCWGSCQVCFWGLVFPDRQSKQLGPSPSFSNSACREVLWKSQRKVPTFHEAHHAH